MLWLAFAYPIAALCILALLVAFTIWIIPKVWRMIRAIVDRVIGFFDRSHRRRPDGPPRGTASLPFGGSERGDTHR